jgi:hypothetical protein
MLELIKNPHEGQLYIDDEGKRWFYIHSNWKEIKYSTVTSGGTMAMNGTDIGQPFMKPRKRAIPIMDFLGGTKCEGQSQND